MDFWKGVGVIAAGILIAAAVIWGVYEARQPSDLDCALQRAEHAVGDLPLHEVHESCRAGLD